eukprot:1159896-Pelagomonas_calceolata.AAC.1
MQATSTIWGRNYFGTAVLRLAEPFVFFRVTVLAEYVHNGCDIEAPSALKADAQLKAFALEP